MKKRKRTGKQIPYIIIGVTLLASITGCTMRETAGELEEYRETPEISAEEIETKLEEGSAALSEFEKRMLFDTELPALVELRDNETYEITLPFDTDNVTFQTDDPEIAKVSEIGIVTPEYSGGTIIHIMADGIAYHIRVKVNLAQIEPIVGNYAIYEAATYDAERIYREASTYASSVDGLTIQESLVEGEPLLTDQFDRENATEGYAVRYRILTSLDYLRMVGCSKIGIEVLGTDEGYQCNYYATRG